jgi:hypothetical protein
MDRLLVVYPSGFIIWCDPEKTKIEGKINSAFILNGELVSDKIGMVYHDWVKFTIENFDKIYELVSKHRKIIISDLMR